ncbi:MAG TPA: 4Fe-4S dicluster domain-containing protein [Anaeromyxobacteraceae bacterium]|nr:4Fe-4S dicluster domain-containing protein [Anaeromyxobacteraceae bacterium]
MTGRRPIQAYRRAAGAAQALLFLGLPFLRAGGESALRFDVPTLTLHVMGASLAMSELFVLLPATFLAAAALALVTVAFGRVWCGWSCPQTVLGDLTRLVQPLPGRRRRPWRRAAGVALAAAVAALFSAATLWYFVTPADFAGRLAAGELGPVLSGAWAALGATLFLDLTLVRGRFCATTCPYARLQGVLYDRHTLAVAYDERRDADCVDCGACVRVCPTGIDIRDGLQMACIACAECADACDPIMLKLRRAPKLIGYFYGPPGTPRRLRRPAVAALAAATLAALVATVAAGVSAAEATLDLTVVPDAGFAPRRAADGRALNAYQLSLENRARAAVTVRLAASAPGLEAEVRPGEVALGPGEHRRLRLVIEARGPAGSATGTLTAGAAGEGARPATRSSPIRVVVPEVR